MFILSVYFWFCWVFAASRAFSSCCEKDYSSSVNGRLIAGAPCCRTRTLEHVGSVIVEHGLSCSSACGIFSDQDSNPCSLPWQMDSFFFLLLFLFISWRLITLQYCSGFCHTLTWMALLLLSPKVFIYKRSNFTFCTDISNCKLYSLNL